MSDIVLADCRNLVCPPSEFNEDVGIDIDSRIFPEGAEDDGKDHWEVLVGLRAEGYWVLAEQWEAQEHPGYDDVGWEDLGAYYTYLELVPHPDEPRRQDDDVWPSFSWMDSYSNQCVVVSLPDEVVAFAIDTIRTDSFFRLR